MKMHRGDGKSLKGSNKCSVWHRHTFMSPHVTMQPEGLRHLRMVVAVLQAALAGGVPLTQGVATGLIAQCPFRAFSMSSIATKGQISLFSLEFRALPFYGVLFETFGKEGAISIRDKTF